MLLWVRILGLFGPSMLFYIDITSAVLGLMNWIWNIKSDDEFVQSNINVSYLSISLSLNVLLTLMIIARLLLHSRQIQSAVGVAAGVGRLYRTIIAVLVESCALGESPIRAPQRVAPPVRTSVRFCSGVKGSLWKTAALFSTIVLWVQWRGLEGC